MPEGAGDGLDEASNDTKAIMDVQPTPATAFAPPSVIPKAAKIEATMMKVAAQVEKALGMCGPSGGVTAAFATLKATTITLTSIYTSAAAVPGGEPGARVAFTMGYQQALSAAMGAAVSSLAGDWDMHSCLQATPAAHGPGFVIQACKTIFINKRPAVVKGHKVVEAAGGSAPVNIGCGTVFFGDKAPSSGGDSPAASQENSRSEAPDQSPPSEATKPNEAGNPGEMSTSPAAKPPEPMMSPDVCGLSKLPDIGVRTILKRYSSGHFGWTSKYDIELQGGSLVVTTRIKLVNRLGPKPAKGGPLPQIGPPLSPAEKATIKSDIEGKLSNKGYIHRDKCKKGKSCRCPEIGCCKIPIKVVVELVETGFHHEINLFPGRGQAFSDSWYKIKKRPNTYAHETGHLLGFYDEYAGGAVGPPPRWEIQGGVIMDTGLIVPGEYYWEFRDWLKHKIGEDLTVVAFDICRP